MVGLKYNFNVKLLGTEEFVGAFFDNIIFHLNKEKYPKICTKLHFGKLPCSDIPEAIEELHQIKKEFDSISPEKIIWDIKKIKGKPQWANIIRSDVNSLSNYFITKEGIEFFDVILEVLNKAMIAKYDVVIYNLFIRDDKQPVSEYHG